MDPAAGRTILHVDMDAFFASVEQLRRPELAGRPVIVGGDGERGVVAAASYEARVHGVHSAMPSVRARRLCPEAVFVPGDHEHYREVSRRVMAIFTSYTPLVEPLSLDEAFLDVTGAIAEPSEAPTLARAIKDAVTAAESLPCSVGVAANKLLAKLASEEAKPRVGPRGPQPGPGVHVVRPGHELAFLHPLPMTRLFGVGPKTAQRLDRIGIETIGDLARVGPARVQAAVGRSAGAALVELARGVDDRPVVADGERKSISQETTFPRDLHRTEELTPVLTAMADEVARDLRRAKRMARTVTIKMRFHDFATVTRSTTVAEGIDSGAAIARLARSMIERVDASPGVRLVGLGVSALRDERARQLTLDTDGRGSLDEVVDQLRERFGSNVFATPSARDRRSR